MSNSHPATLPDAALMLEKGLRANGGRLLVSRSRNCASAREHPPSDSDPCRTLQLHEVKPEVDMANPGLQFAPPPGMSGKLTKKLLNTFPQRFITDGTSIILGKNGRKVGL